MMEEPRYKPRKSGLYIEDKEALIETYINEGSTESLLKRLASYDVPKRINDALLQFKDGSLFRDPEHSYLFTTIYNGIRGEQMRKNRRYLSSVFLLSSSDWLWDQVKTNVTDKGIRFEDMRICNLSVEEYILFHVAKDIYMERQFVKLNELSDPDVASDEAVRLSVNAYALKLAGIDLLINRKELHHDE